MTATPKLTYYEQLKHPLWQRKRLEILERARYECENCGSKDRTLHVHHSYYEKGAAPWEYPDRSLHCLCEDCHEKAQAVYTAIQRQLGNIYGSDMECLLGYAAALDVGFEVSEEPIEIQSYEFAQGVGDRLGLTAEEVINACKEGIVDGSTLCSICQKKTQQSEPLSTQK